MCPEMDCHPFFLTHTTCYRFVTSRHCAPIWNLPKFFLSQLSLKAVLLFSCRYFFYLRSYILHPSSWSWDSLTTSTLILSKPTEPGVEISLTNVRNRAVRGASFFSAILCELAFIVALYKP